MEVFPITIKIYAESEQEADEARRALGGFVDQMGRRGIHVTGGKIAEGVSRWERNAFVRQQIINHFKKQ